LSRPLILAQKTILIALLLLFFQKTSNAQIVIGVRWVGFTAHLKEYSYSKYYKGRLDKKGRFVANDGFAITIDAYLNEHFFIKVAQSIMFHDCGGKLFGMSHVGVGYNYTDIYPSEAAISFGPMFFYRKSWLDLPYYSDPVHFFKVSKNQKWQTKFVWHGGTLEYAYHFNNQQAFSLNVVPAIPELFTFAPGWKVTLPRK
jgi:hypothetical protein